MRIIGGHEIGGLIARVAPSLGEAIAAWYAETAEAAWTSSSDIAPRYQDAVFDNGGRVLFDLKTSNYCVSVRINYKMQIVCIEYIGSFVGAPRVSISRPNKLVKS